MIAYTTGKIFVLNIINVTFLFKSNQNYETIIIIMQNQQSQQIDLLDSFHQVLPFTSSENFMHSQQKQEYTSQQDSKWIEKFLSPSAFVEHSSLNFNTLEDQKEPHITETLSQSKEHLIDNAETQKIQRSVFHNFQKHIITLLKKIVYIRRVDISYKLAGARALDLWKIFRQGRDFSKKSLYLVFGVVQNSNYSQISRLAQSIPEFQKILMKYGAQEIQNAQALLRKIVIEKLSVLSKATISQQCKMAKFEQFYAYFLHFIEQLQGDGLCKRLKKYQKQKLFERTQNQINEDSFSCM